MFFGSPSAALDPQAAAALGERAIILLLILAFQQKDEESPNPFRDELASWAVDEEAPSFVEVYSVLCRAIESNEETSLLLYLLLYLNEQFRSFLLSTSEPEALLLPLAKTLYSTISLNPSYSHLYMLLIILLLFSQDDVFAGRCYQITIQPPLWLKERPAFKTLSLGDFLVLVLMKILLTNLSSGRDLFFHSNCVAALANFARLSVNMHPYVAQKLVGLIETVGRRWGRAEESAPEKAIYEDLLSVLLEIINAVLATNLHQNRDLVHAVLLRHELFLQYRSHPRLADLVDNISIVSKYFMAKVDDATLKITSAGEVLALIDAWSKQWSPRTLKAFPELRFQYEAKAESSAFCLPYVWSLAYRVIVGVEWPPDAALTRTFLEEHGIGTVGLV
ncbi:Dymeclin [Hyaloraphidium curvatum]|nr:Dymeclin [Hyaloraphidium curvatum]